MKKEKSEELYVKWVDGLLEPEEEVLMKSLFDDSPELRVELEQSREIGSALRKMVPDSVEPPYGDFFNSQLMRKVDLEIVSQSPAKKAERWWQSFRWAWAPAGALSLVLAFFAGHRVAKPDSGSTIADIPMVSPGMASELPTVYFTSDTLNARVIPGADGGVSAIVVNGLEALSDDLDLSAAATDSEMDGLPVSYAKSAARSFQ